MSSSSCALSFALLLALSGDALSAQAQQGSAGLLAQGFAVERFYPSTSGGGWFVMDTLDIQGGLGGAVAMTLGYARNPLLVTDGTQTLAVVSDQAFIDVGAAITYKRFRAYFNLDTPLVSTGDSGMVSGYTFTAPSVNLANHPDTLADARIGVDVRILGEPRSRFRLGLSAQLFAPLGNRADYLTDGTFRGMVRVLYAGDLGRFTYAGQLGAHIRPLDDSPIPGSPNGSELLFGAAAGVKLPVWQKRSLFLVLGPEVYGATAFRSFFGNSSTALEGLLSARLEGTRDDRAQLRVKLGAGAGLNPQFGAPEWRVVLGVELFNHNKRSSSNGGAAP